MPHGRIDDKVTRHERVQKTRNSSKIVSTTNTKSAGNVGDGIAAIRRGVHDVSYETPHEQSDVSYEDRNEILQMHWLYQTRTHERYKQVVKASLLHTSETWICTRELADTLHDRKSRCFEMIGTRKWKRCIEELVSREWSTAWQVVPR